MSYVRFFLRNNSSLPRSADTSCSLFLQLTIGKIIPSYNWYFTGSKSSPYGRDALTVALRLLSDQYAAQPLIRYSSGTAWLSTHRKDELF